MLKWVDDNTRELVRELTLQIASLGSVTHKPTGTDYIFYRGTPSAKSSFAVLLLRKEGIRVRLRVDPATFKDPNKWLSDKVYKPWFFKLNGQERTFDMKDKSQMPYAMELIKQSYDISK